MQVKIKSVKSAQIVPSNKAYCLDIVIKGVDVYELLAPIDITVAIDYYGVTELLDMIGKEQLNTYLKNLSRGDVEEVEILC